MRPTPYARSVPALALHSADSAADTGQRRGKAKGYGVYQWRRRGKGIALPRSPEKKINRKIHKYFLTQSKSTLIIHNVAKMGRPRIQKPCPWCGVDFASREFRDHEPNCKERPPGGQIEGWVYALLSEDGSTLKVGHTRNPEARFAFLLGSGNPQRLGRKATILKLLPGPASAEVELHSKMERPIKKAGATLLDWFEATAANLEAISVFDGGNRETDRRCLHCGNNWITRTPDRPVACPCCKSQRWDRPPMRPGRPAGSVAKVGGLTAGPVPDEDDTQDWQRSMPPIMEKVNPPKERGAEKTSDALQRLKRRK